MRIHVFTVFPEIFESPLRASLLGKAGETGKLEVEVRDIRDYARDRHRTVDDAPFGGGPGMVMKCEPLFDAVEDLARDKSLDRVVLLSPKGRPLTQALVKQLAQENEIALICGRYEGVDERVTERLCTDETSIGDYVLSGGEIPALVLIEAVSRMIPGVVGDWESVETDSFYGGLLGAPQYTRPADFRGMEAPEVLRNGNHAAISRWRRKEQLRLTSIRRPDLLPDVLSETDRELMDEITDETDADHEARVESVRKEEIQS